VPKIMKAHRVELHCLPNADEVFGDVVRHPGPWPIRVTREDVGGVVYQREDSVVALFKKLRSGHPKLADLGPRAQDVEKVPNSCASILDALLPVRNRASVAHPNAELLGEPEARLVINVGRSILDYLDAKLS